MAKVKKAIIIRRLRVESSMQYAKQCADTCEAHGIDYEYLDGVEFMGRDEAFEAVGVKRDSKYTLSAGHCNCNASHIKAWRRVAEIGEPCVIFEHDALVKGDVTNIDIPDMSVVTFGHRIIDESLYTPVSPIKELVEIKSALGCHAYAITPATASFLVKDAEDNGVRSNNDVQLMFKPVLPLFVADPPQVVCWPRMSTREHQLENQPERKTSGDNWTVKSSLTDSWYAGMTYR